MTGNNRRRWERTWITKRRRISLSKRRLARAMSKAGHTYREISEALDVSIGALNYIVRQEGPEFDALAKEIKKRNVARHRMLAEHILSSIDDSDIMRAPLKNKVIAAAILTDKAELIEKNEAGKQPPVAAFSEQNTEQAEGTFSDEESVDYAQTRTT